MKNDVFNKFVIRKMYLIIRVSYYISIHNCITIKTFCVINIIVIIFLLILKLIIYKATYFTCVSHNRYLFYQH